MSIRAGSIVCLMFFACENMQMKSQVADPWVRVAPMDAFKTLSAAPSSDIFPVAENHVGEAIRDLQTASAVKITSGRADQLTGRTLSSGDYYLIRALCGACATGKYDVYFSSDGRVVVAHLSLASRSRPPTRWPIVARLPSAPADVYVQFSTIR